MSETPILPAIALIIALMLPASGLAQVPVEVSNEKMIYGGKVFYMHNVQKGQTLYSISRAYKVSIDAITHDNVISSSGIQEGQVLRIPSAADNSELPSQPRPAAQPVQRPTAAVASPTPSSSVASEPALGIRLARERIMYNGKPYYMHEVQKGQTLYSLARAYKVTILDIDRENAIPAGGVQAGQVLRIPASSSLTAQEEGRAVIAQERYSASSTQSGSSGPSGGTTKPADSAMTEVQEPTAGVESKPDHTLQTDEAAPSDGPAHQPEATKQAPTRQPAAKKAPPVKKKIHRVQKGESLADIAKKYNLSVQELKQANKGVIFAMPDMRLVIPVSGDQEPDNQ